MPHMLRRSTTIVTTAPNHKDTALQFASVTKRYWRIIFVHTGTKIVTLGELLANLHHHFLGQQTAQLVLIGLVPSGLQGHKVGLGRAQKAFRVKVSGHAPAL